MSMFVNTLAIFRSITPSIPIPPPDSFATTPAALYPRVVSPASAEGNDATPALYSSDVLDPVASEFRRFKTPGSTDSTSLVLSEPALLPVNRKNDEFRQSQVDLLKKADALFEDACSLVCVEISDFGGVSIRIPSVEDMAKAQAAMQEASALRQKVASGVPSDLRKEIYEADRSDQKMFSELQNQASVFPESQFPNQRFLDIEQKILELPPDPRFQPQQFLRIDSHYLSRAALA
jgi:hypothetical protein